MHHWRSLRLLLWICLIRRVATKHQCHLTESLLSYQTSLKAPTHLLVSNLSILDAKQLPVLCVTYASVATTKTLYAFIDRHCIHIPTKL